MTEAVPPTCDEHREELIRLVEKAGQIKVMTECAGWSQVVHPALVRRRQATVSRLCRETDRENIPRLQGAIQELDSILELVASAPEMAQEAQASLEAEGQPDGH